MSVICEYYLGHQADGASPDGPIARLQDSQRRERVTNGYEGPCMDDGTQQVFLVNAPAPDITDHNDVIVAVTGTTVCGSDLHLLERS